MWDSSFPPYLHLFFELVGVWDDPLPAEEWGEAIAEVEAVAGPTEVARGLELAAGQPVMGPVRRGGRAWSEFSRQRASAIAAVYRDKTRRLAS